MHFLLLRNPLASHESPWFQSAPKTKPWILVRRNTFYFKDKYLTYCLKWSPGYIFYLISKSIQNCTNWPICLDQITSMLQDLMSHFSIKATTGSVHWEGLIWEDERHFVLHKVWSELNWMKRSEHMAWCSMRRPLFHSICILCSLFQQNGQYGWAVRDILVWLLLGHKRRKCRDGQSRLQLNLFRFSPWSFICLFCWHWSKQEPLRQGGLRINCFLQVQRAMPAVCFIEPPLRFHMLG